MKIAISAQGNTPDSDLDPRFGRAPWFLFVDSESLNYEALSNEGAAAGGGAGITAAQMVADRGAGAVITGNLGPNAMRVLAAAGIALHRGEAVSVWENVSRFKKGSLAVIDAAVPSHFGIGGPGRGR